MRIRPTAQFQIVATDEDARELERFLQIVKTEYGKRKGTKLLISLIKKFNDRYNRITSSK